jgi:hypothetical protein
MSFPRRAHRATVRGLYAAAADAARPFIDRDNPRARASTTNLFR